MGSAQVWKTSCGVDDWQLVTDLSIRSEDAECHHLAAFDGGVFVSCNESINIYAGNELWSVSASGAVEHIPRPLVELTALAVDHQGSLWVAGARSVDPHVLFQTDAVYRRDAGSWVEVLDLTRDLDASRQRPACPRDMRHPSSGHG